MLPATVIRRLEALGEIAKQGKRLNGLFRLMEHPILWQEAYATIYSNHGALTPGVDRVGWPQGRLAQRERTLFEGISVIRGQFLLSSFSYRSQALPR